jgi:GxxExxY protein
MSNSILQRDDLVYPKLSYKIVGILFDVYNELGYGFDEKTYQKAVAIAFKDSKIKFQEQVHAPLAYRGNKVGLNFFDFFIDDRVVLELKKGDRFSKTHIDQVYKYLMSKDLKLGILAYFSPRKLLFKRIVNISDS